MRRLVIIMVSILVILSLLSGCKGEATPAPAVTQSPKYTSPASPTLAATSSQLSPTAKASLVVTPTAKPLPKTVSLSSWAPGTTSYVAGLGMNSVLSKYADIKVAVEPVPSPVLGYARMAKGEVELVFSVGSVMWGTYTGAFDSPRYNKVRDLFYTYTSNHCLMTRTDTGIGSIPDLRKKKISVSSPAAPPTDLVFRALLKEYGMDADKDVTVIYHSTTPEMYDNLKERRVDAAFGTALRISMEEQMKSPGGGLVVSIPKEKMLAMQKDFPFLFPGGFPAGFPGTKPETLSFLFGLGVTSGADVPDDLIYTIVKVVFEHIDEIKTAHADLADFSLTYFARYPSIPFHNGAIRYYKEKGVWTKELDDLQKNLLEKGK